MTIANIAMALTKDLWSLMMQVKGQKCLDQQSGKSKSETPLRKAQVRFYCQPCADDAQNWPDGTFYSLKEQLEDAINQFAGREKLDVELP